VAKLVIYEEVEGEETIFEDFELSTNRILIGSGSDNHLILDAPDIDPAHASLELRNDDWILQDLGGPGGTLVNGQSIDGPYRLQNNDFIELGTIKLRFQADQFELEEEGSAEEETSPEDEEHISGRVWFAAIAGGTLAAIFIILLLLIIADFLGILKISDLLPWLGRFY
jgi:pSer/pThr/pTyr-binding forkhead associated (FHA) protein